METNARVLDDLRHQFTTTHWSVVLAAAQDHAPRSREAWEQLAQAYWPPLYAYIRRSGHGRQDACDLTQSFFMSLASRQALEGLVPDGGRFRSFLLVCLKHFLADHHRRLQTARRRPEGNWLSLDDPEAEGRYQAELVDQATPEWLFERRWAGLVLDRALAQLEARHRERGQLELFTHLLAHLISDPEAVPHAELAIRLQTTESAVKSEMYRLRNRFRFLFRKEVAATVPPEAVEDEMLHLAQVLAG